MTMYHERFADLEPSFLRFETNDFSSKVFQMQDAIAGAHGVMFVCPKCYVSCGGRAGAHSIICWTPAVPQTVSPQPGRWAMQGTGYNDLTLVAGSSSVLLLGPGGCQAHFFVRDGRVLAA